MRTIRRCAPLLAATALALGACAPAPAPVPPAPPPSRPAPPPPSTAPVDTTAPPPRREEPQPPPPRPEGVPSHEPLLAIGLAWDLDSLTVVPMVDADLDGPTETKLRAGERLHLRRTRHGALCLARGGRKTWQAAMWRGDTLWLTPTEGDRNERLFRWSNRTWRGQLKIFVNARGSLTLATRLPLESYLLGVLPGELGPLLTDELREAGRAQAMAARSFTLFYTGRRGVEGFDLFCSVEDQVYASVESERPLATQCVRTTAGQVATYQGQPIRANYSSTCGGITADVWEAWPDPPRPYLLSRRDAGPSGGDYCQASPHYRWHEEWSAAEFLSNLHRFGPTYGVPLPPGGLGQLRDVEVRARSRSGRVWILDVTTTEGHVSIPAYSLRQVLRRPGNPNAILRSNLFKIGVRRDPRSGHVLAVVASGAGSGHGVGLCQTGALGMARAGIKGEDILRHYFTGVEIRREY